MAAREDKKRLNRTEPGLSCLEDNKNIKRSRVAGSRLQALRVYKVSHLKGTIKLATSLLLYFSNALVVHPSDIVSKVKADHHKVTQLVVF